MRPKSSRLRADSVNDNRYVVHRPVDIKVRSGRRRKPERQAVEMSKVGLIRLTDVDDGLWLFKGDRRGS